ncbi:MAG: hypothetical protein DMF87_02415 [Acidobacteria bacterium]|nr:MAG: hypothetical protein DMF87_02415 [Acidobacteriota bacterium]
MTARRYGRVLGAYLVIVFTCTSAWAQATATISGTVRDQSGAVLPGVTITVTQQETGLTRTTVSNETGSYVLPNLPLGPYRLEATLQGFATFAQNGIVLQVNANPVVNATMGVSAIAEEVQVTGVAPLVDTRSTGVGTVVESERIVELPLNARQVTQLIMLSGLAVQTGSSPAFSMNTGVRISVAGGNEYGVSYSLDGAPHLNNFDGTGMHLPFPDALQEFKLATGAQEAGGTIRAGASVSAVTKAGTNAFHGDLFEFGRDSRFNAPDPLSQRKDGLKRNQFGGVLGGPIMRFHGLRVGGLQRRPRHRARCTVCQQPDRFDSRQPGGLEHLAQDAQTDRRLRQGVLGRTGARERIADPDPGRHSEKPEALVHRPLHADDGQPPDSVRRRRQQRPGHEPAGL